MAKKDTKKKVKKPKVLKQKQKQKQTQNVTINIKNGGSKAPRKTSSAPATVTRSNYPIFIQTDPLPPATYAPAPAPVLAPVLETVNTPTKLTNSIEIQSSIPQSVAVSRPSGIPRPTREAVINLTDLYKTPDDDFYYDNTTPIARRTRAVLALSTEEVERRRLDRNEKARLKRIEKRMGG